jgi:hypothetical protein
MDDYNLKIRAVPLDTSEQARGLLEGVFDFLQTNGIEVVLTSNSIILTNLIDDVASVITICDGSILCYGLIQYLDAVGWYYRGLSIPLSDPACFDCLLLVVRKIQAPTADRNLENFHNDSRGRGRRRASRKKRGPQSQRTPHRR